MLERALKEPPPDAASGRRVVNGSARSPVVSLVRWLEVEAGRPLTRTQAMQLLVQAIAAIDHMIGRQVDAILHHPALQKLEASWRGLRYLVEQVPEGAAIKVRVLHLPWKELWRDLDRALEFDQSQVFFKVYEEEFGMPGGQPFGVLLGDYELRHVPAPESPTDDLRALMKMSSVAAAAFAPFIAGAHPSLLELERFAELEQPRDLARGFKSSNYVLWRTLRQTEDARFVGLTLPRTLMRLPYGAQQRRGEAFCYREEVEGPGGSQYLWGNAVYALGGVLVRTFDDCGWLASIYGQPAAGTLGGGLVATLPVASFGTDPERVAPRPSTDALITDRLEKELSELGFIPLCHCPDTDLAMFASAQSIQVPGAYKEAVAGTNARLSAMLSYILCVSRFAHYLKVIARDKIASFATSDLLEENLKRWLMKYISSSDSPDPEQMARFPLSDANVQIRDRPGKAGSFLCVIHLKPHTQVDQVATSVRLVTELAPGRTK
jgi:type VI secretion system protein ImpD